MAGGECRCGETTVSTGTIRQGDALKEALFRWKDISIELLDVSAYSTMGLI
jgi:hypothetical protein